MFSINSTCHYCKGEGKTIASPCYECRGQGVNYEKKTLKIKIPRGIDNGQSIKILGEGEAIKGGDAGDLYISINVREHSFYERENADLHAVIPISVPQAVLGDKVTFTTISNKKIQIKIVPGTQNDTVLRIRNEGMPDLRGSHYGNLFLKVRVEIPIKPKNEIKKLYQEISH